MLLPSAIMTLFCRAQKTFSGFMLNLLSTLSIYSQLRMNVLKIYLDSGLLTFESVQIEFLKTFKDLIKQMSNRMTKTIVFITRCISTAQPLQFSLCLRGAKKRSSIIKTRKLTHMTHFLKKQLAPKCLSSALN